MKLLMYILAAICLLMVTYDIGFNIGVNHIQTQAVQNSLARWVSDDSGKTEFRWINEHKNDTIYPYKDSTNSIGKSNSLSKINPEVYYKYDNDTTNFILHLVDQNGKTVDIIVPLHTNSLILNQNAIPLTNCE
jgi:hypothetical protein